LSRRREWNSSHKQQDYVAMAIWKENFLGRGSDHNEMHNWGEEL